MFVRDNKHLYIGVKYPPVAYVEDLDHLSLCNRVTLIGVRMQLCTSMNENALATLFAILPAITKAKNYRKKDDLSVRAFINSGHSKIFRDTHITESDG